MNNGDEYFHGCMHHNWRLLLFTFKLLHGSIWLFWITLTGQWFYLISQMNILYKYKLISVRLFSIIWYWSERNWCEWRPHAATRREQYLFMRQFYVGKRLMESKYTMMAIDSNRILFHAIADVILCELFFFSLAFFCIFISVTVT